MNRLIFIIGIIRKKHIMGHIHIIRIHFSHFKGLDFHFYVWYQQSLYFLLVAMSTQAIYLHKAKEREWSDVSSARFTFLFIRTVIPWIMLSKISSLSLYGHKYNLNFKGIQTFEAMHSCHPISNNYAILWN